MAHNHKLVIGITIGGSVPLIRGQAQYFSERGFDVYLMAPDEPKSRRYCEEENCQLLPVKIERYLSPLKDIVTIIDIYRKLRQLRPDVVNVGTPKMGLLGIIGAWLAGVPGKVYTCRGLRYEHEQGIQRIILRTTEKIAGSLADKIICISPSVAKKAIDQGIFTTAKVRVIGQGSSNGMDLSRFAESAVSIEKRNQLQAELSLEGCFVFGFVGRLVDRKGINEIFAAFQRVYKRDSSVRLVLVGKADKSQLSRPEIISEIEEHPGVLWVGWQDDIPLYMSIFDVFIMPAWWEGFGNTYLEAAAMGKPVIGSQGTGCVDAVSDGFNGVTLPIKNVDVVEDAMISYLKNENLRLQHGESGKEWVLNFKPEKIWSGIFQVYQEVTN